MDENVRFYLEKLDKKQRQIIDIVRNIIITDFPKIKETAMKEGLWYEGKFYLAAFRDHVNLGVGVTGLNKKELGNFEGKGKTMRHLKFYSPDDIDKEKLRKLMRLVYEKNNCVCQINFSPPVREL